MRRNFFSASKSPVAVQRSGWSPSRQRFTFLATRCTVDKHDSIGLVVASFRRNTAPTPKRCTVSVSSRPSSRLRAALGLIISSCRKIFCNAGVHIEDGQRFGLHNLRHSLSNWLVNKAKVEPKTVQGILRHANIQTTLDLYAQDDGDETRAAQGEYLTALGVGTHMMQ